MASCDQLLTSEKKIETDVAEESGPEWMTQDTMCVWSGISGNTADAHDETNTWNPVLSVIQSEPDRQMDGCQGIKAEPVDQTEVSDVFHQSQPGDNGEGNVDIKYESCASIGLSPSPVDSWKAECCALSPGNDVSMSKVKLEPFTCSELNTSCVGSNARTEPLKAEISSLVKIEPVETNTSSHVEIESDKTDTSNDVLTEPIRTNTSDEVQNEPIRTNSKGDVLITQVCHIVRSEFMSSMDEDGNEGTGGEQVIKCSNCEKIFTKKKNLNQHKRQVHQKEDAFTCEVCGKNFTRRSTLERHSRRKHKTSAALPSPVLTPLLPPLLTSPPPSDSQDYAVRPAFQMSLQKEKTGSSRQLPVGKVSSAVSKKGNSSIKSLHACCIRLVRCDDDSRLKITSMSRLMTKFANREKSGTSKFTASTKISTEVAESKKGNPLSKLQYGCYVRLVRCEEDPRLKSFVGRVTRGKSRGKPIKSANGIGKYIQMDQQSDSESVCVEGNSRPDVADFKNTKMFNNANRLDTLTTCSRPKVNKIATNTAIKSQPDMSAPSKPGAGLIIPTRHSEHHSAMNRALQDPNALVFRTADGKFELKCGLCPKTCFLAKDLISHKREAHKCAGYMCEECTEEFIIDAAHKKHQCRAKHRCDICGILCKQPKILHQHTIMMHKKAEEGSEHTCQSGSLISKSQERADRHECRGCKMSTLEMTSSPEKMCKRRFVESEPATVVNAGDEGQVGGAGYRGNSTDVTDAVSSASGMRYLCEVCLNLYPSSMALQKHKCGRHPETVAPSYSGVDSTSTLPSPVMATMPSDCATGTSNLYMVGVSDPNIAGISNLCMADISYPFIVGTSCPPVGNISNPVMFSLPSLHAAGMSKPHIATASNLQMVSMPLSNVGIDILSEVEQVAKVYSSVMYTD